MIKNIIRIILLLISGISSANATDYYVNKTSNCSISDGSQSAPWKTIQKAANKAIAGDTVFVMNGVYFEIITIKNSGTNQNCITFQAYPGHKPVIDGTGNPGWHGIINIFGKSYIKIDGLEIRNNTTGWGINICHDDSTLIQVSKTEQQKNGAIFDSNLFRYKSSHHIELSNLLIHDTAGEAVEVKGNVHHILIQNNTVHTGLNGNSGIVVYTWPYDVDFNSPDFNPDLMKEFNYLPPYDIPDEHKGIDLKCAQYQDCPHYNINSNAVFFPSNTSIDLDKVSVSVNDVRPRHILISNNTAYNYPKFAGIATERADYVTATNNYVYNCGLGLDIGCGKHNIIKSNTTNDCKTGIALSGNEKTTVSDNFISGSTDEGFLSYDHEPHPCEVHAKNKWFRNVVVNSNIAYKDYRKNNSWINAESKKQEIFNNLFCNNNQVIFDHTLSLKVYNNTVYTNSGYSAIVIKNSSKNAEIKNNIFSVSGYFVSPISIDSSSQRGAIIDYNFYQKRGGSVTAIGSNSLTGDPKLSSPLSCNSSYHLSKNKYEECFTPNSGSPVIDMGTKDGLPAEIPYSGSAPDMGAFEVTAEGEAVRE